ncbi:MAG: 30S ribosomal protein S20 [Anaerolineae bacterium]|nr:30S ribosomal protein S20 [Anaerolineae bacterium]
MANHKSALKRIRNSAKKRARNRVVITNARTVVRSAREAIVGGKADEAKTATVAAISALDKAASKGIIHANNAARRKSRLMKRLAALEATNK